MWSRSQALGLLVLTALPTAAIVGCATPAPVVRLFPRGDDFIWVSGLAAVTREAGGIRVVAAFDHQDPHMLGLRVEVENDSGEAVEIDPEDMTFTTCAGPGIKSCAPGRGVIDPERMINRLDAERSREAAGAANDQAFLTPFFILGAVGDVASAPTRHPTYEGDRVANEMDRDAARHEQASSQIAFEKERWSSALRRTTLLPGKGLAGYVYVPIDSRARFVWLQIPVGEHNYPFCFRQLIHQVG